MASSNWLLAQGHNLGLCGLLPGIRAVRIFDLQHGLKHGLVVGPMAGFFLGGFLRLRQQAGDVGQGTGAAWRAALCGQRVKELAEHVVDVNLRDVIAGGIGQLGGEVVFARGGPGVSLAIVGQAEAVALGMGGEAAAVSTGILELAKVERVGWSGVRHRESIANEYHSVKILVYTDRALQGTRTVESCSNTCAAKWGNEEMASSEVVVKAQGCGTRGLAS